MQEESVPAPHLTAVRSIYSAASFGVAPSDSDFARLLNFTPREPSHLHLVGSAGQSNPLLLSAVNQEVDELVKDIPESSKPESHTADETQ
jgi:hypothetical protein